MTRAVTFAVAVSLTVVPGASAQLIAEFFTAKGAAYCAVELFPHEGTGKWLVCWRPRNGFVVSVTARGRSVAKVERGYRGSHGMAGRPRLLRVGQSWWATGTRTGHGSAPEGAIFRCTNRATGLRCVNRAGHGWQLARLRGYRLF